MGDVIRPEFGGDAAPTALKRVHSLMTRYFPDGGIQPGLIKAALAEIRAAERQGFRDGCKVCGVDLPPDDCYEHLDFSPPTPQEIERTKELADLYGW